MKYLTKTLIFIIFFLLIIFYSSNKENLRCTKFGEKFFDDILGFNIAHQRCMELAKYKILKENSEDKIKLTNLDKNTFKLNLVRFDDISLKKNVKCPKNRDVIVILGQSNAANHLTNFKKIIPSNNLNYFNGKCYLLSDPVLGATGIDNSMVPALSKKILNKKPIIYLTYAYAGTSIKDWSKENSPLTNYANENILKISKTNNIKYIIWIHGEADAYRDIDYKTHFLKFKKNLLKNLKQKDIKKIKFILTQTSICGYDTEMRDKKLNEHQKKLGKIKNIYVTEVTDNLDFNYRHDKCHLNAFGIKAVSSEIADLINNQK